MVQLPSLKLGSVRQLLSDTTPWRTSLLRFTVPKELLGQFVATGLVQREDFHDPRNVNAFNLIQQTQKLNEWRDIMKPNYTENYKTRIKRSFTKLLLAIEIKEQIPTGMMMIQTKSLQVVTLRETFLNPSSSLFSVCVSCSHSY